MTSPLPSPPIFGCLVPLVRDSPQILGHNIIAFDLTVLSWYHQLKPLELVNMALEGRLVDTLLLARLADPPPSGGSGNRHDLSSVGERFGVGGKTGALRMLKRKYKGLDQIPVDDSDYLAKKKVMLN